MTRALAIAACALVASVLVAGCLPPPAPPPGGWTSQGNACRAAEAGVSPIASTAEPAGANAYAYAFHLVCRPTGDGHWEPRYRIPGTPGQAEAAAWLHHTLSTAGWAASYQNFTGRDYVAMERGSVSNYWNSCDAANRSRVLDLPFSNVVATRGAGDMVILAAHYDSKRYASKDPDPTKVHEPVLGANDGASGVGVILEVARAWGSTPLPMEVRLLLTDGEDGFEDCHPLAGAVAYARGLSAQDKSRIRGLLILDMVGNASVPFMLSSNSAALREHLRQAARDEGVEPVANAANGAVFDDHTPFMELGVPSLDLIPSNFAQTDFWHTTHDVPSRLSPDFLGDVARVTVRFVEALAADGA